MSRRSRFTFFSAVISLFMLGGFMLGGFMLGGLYSAPAMAQETEETPAVNSDSGALPYLFFKEADIFESAKSFPNLRFEDQTGKQVTLSEHDGKIRLVNVWATWCPPCLEELPSLDRLQEMAGDERFKVITLMADNQRVQEGLNYLKENDLKNLTPYADTGTRYLTVDGVRGLPTTFVLNPEGKEIARITGPADWMSEDAIHFVRTIKNHYYE